MSFIDDISYSLFVNNVFLGVKEILKWDCKCSLFLLPNLCLIDQSEYVLEYKVQ